MKFHNILWYNYSPAECFTLLESSEVGLSEKDALKRLRTFGFNRLPRSKRASDWLIFVRQFNNILVYILLGAAALSILLGEYADLAIILMAVFINIIVGFIQERKAETQLDLLRDYISYETKVIRDGLIHVIKAEELTPGDVVILESGNQVPADIRLFDVHSLSCSEAVLTGESAPVSKHTRQLSSDITKKSLVVDRKCMVFKGTVIAEGRAKGVVVSTGQFTEIGKIASLLEKTENEETPLQFRLKTFSRVLGLSILAVAGAIVIIGVLRGLSFWDIVLVAMAVAVSAVPEGLLVAVTVILAIGMQRILKKNALVRTLVAAETLGSTSVICVDKTGTITEGRMQAKEVVFWHDSLELTAKKPSRLDPAMEKFLQTSLLVNNADIDVADGHELIGSPTERAILSGSMELNYSLDRLVDIERLLEIPFQSSTKSMYTLNRDGKKFIWAMKGAPEVVLAQCSEFVSGQNKIVFTPKYRSLWQKMFDSYSRRGYRLLAVAGVVAPSDDSSYYREKKLVFYGFWVIEDPLRPDIAATISQVNQAGIRPIMITGDHQLTASEIARQIGLPVGEGSVMEGQELMIASSDDLKIKVRQVSVFARVSPEDKLKIVEALQSNGEVVAMTGDGVNDAPALKAADIGIAVGTGTDVAKETADMVLLDNNFRTIVLAVEQGRIIYSNIKKVIVYLLADSFSELVLIVGSLLAGLPLPITAAQILWVNLITDGFPAAALTVEAGEQGIMKQPPIKKNRKLLDREMKTLIFVIGLFSDIVLFILYNWLLGQGWNIDHVRTVIFAGLGLNSLLYVFSCKSLIRPLWRINIFDNVYLLLAVAGGLLLQVVPIYLPGLNSVLGLRPLGLVEWGMVVTFALMQVVLIELTKIFYRLRTKRQYESFA
ncbi:TPA: ATPase [Candidatus Falkowbacteria bacterium]|nr:ATPase [Candidatus Falkowbacteria bacterium]